MEQGVTAETRMRRGPERFALALSYKEEVTGSIPVPPTNLTCFLSID